VLPLHVGREEHAGISELAKVEGADDALTLLKSPHSTMDLFPADVDYQSGQASAEEGHAVRGPRRVARERLGRSQRDPGRVARAWAELMQRLGYTHYVAQGGDVGAAVTDAMARQAPLGLIGIHTNLLVTALAGTGTRPANPSEDERAALDALATVQQTGSGYFVEQATRPQTIGHALLDSPVALAAWMIEHDTDSYQKISSAFVDGQPSRHLTRDRIVDNITLYWLTGTGASAAPAYWERGRAQAATAGQARPEVSIPAGFTVFPGEIFPAPQSWVQQAYPQLTYFHEADRGGHFAAWEEPEVFARELRDAFRPLR
jgi:pimeloyl-ACP methyl ester carboxylesterase